MWMLQSCIEGGSACILKKPKTISPRVTPLRMGWSLTHQSLIKKLPYRPIEALSFFSFFIRYFLHLHFKCYPLYPPPNPAPQPTHSCFLVLAFPCTVYVGHIIFARPRASPPTDGLLGHFLRLIGT